MARTYVRTKLDGRNRNELDDMFKELYMSLLSLDKTFSDFMTEDNEEWVV